MIVIRRLIAASLFVLVGAAALFAQSDRFVAPAFRGTLGSLYAGWDDFIHATTANTPDRPGSAATGFTFTQLDPSAFITSTGNLYSFSAPLSHEIDVSGLASTPATVVFQTRTLGAAISASTVLLEVYNGLTWTALAAPANELLYSETVGTGFGAALDETRRWTWTLGSITATGLRITFQAEGTSQSFEAAALDLAPAASAIPEPATHAALLGLAALALSALRRRARR